MAVEFDAAKSTRNKEQRESPFYRIDEFDRHNVLIVEEDRQDYGERRLILIGYLDDRLHLAVVTPQQGILRVISLRRANTKEVRFHGQERG